MKTDALLDETPKLDVPGAGLPWPELLAARVIFHWGRSSATKESAQALFKAEQEAITQLARGCGGGKGKRRVLIKRLRGMEDSSRHWSVYMTLDHLRIVNFACMEGIRALSRGQVPARAASTAAVKPSPEAGEEILGQFEQGCELLLKSVEGIANLKTSVRYAHPWFGPLDAAGWHFMAGFHMRLHRKQVEAILKRVGLSD